MSKKDKGRLPPFVPLLLSTLDSRAWRELSHGAQALYVALKKQVRKGRNRAYLSYRTAKAQLRTTDRKVGEWFRELEHYGFIVMVQHGSLGVDGKGKAPHWRLTELGQTTGASSTGSFEQPTCDFLRWDSTPFKRRRDKRTPGAFGCKKQNPTSDVGSTPLPTGEAVVLPTGETLPSESTSDAGSIGAAKTASDVGSVTRFIPLGQASGRPGGLVDDRLVSLGELEASRRKA
jgi:hypothetical protein